MNKYNPQIFREDFKNYFDDISLDDDEEFSELNKQLIDKLSL